MKLYNLLFLVLQQIFFAKQLLNKNQIKLLPKAVTGRKLRELKQNNYMEKTVKVFAKGIPASINQMSVITEGLQTFG